MHQNRLFADDLATGLGDLSHLFFSSSSEDNKAIINMLGVGKEDDCCRVLFHKIDSEGHWGFIGKPKNNRKTTTLKRFMALSEGNDEHSEMSMLGGINVYCSINRFYEWRCNRNLSHLHAHYLDIDTPKHKQITAKQSLLILNNLLGQIKKQKLLSPNAIVYSGSGGWHLYWIYSPVDATATNKQAWSLAANKLVKCFRSDKSFTIDSSASSDATRVLRLPGSFHLGAKDHCRCIYTAPLYSFDQVINQVDVDLGTFLPKPKAKKTSRVGAGQVEGRHNIKDWWLRNYYQLMQVANRGRLIDGTNKAIKGNRDMFLFLCYVAMRHIKATEQEAYDHVLSLNAQYKLFIGSEIETLDQYLSTARTKMYWYESSKLFNIFKNNFGIYVEYLDPEKRRWKKHIKLEDDVRHRIQADAAKQTNQTRKEKTDKAIEQSIQVMASEGLKLSLKAISDHSGVSYATIKRRKALIDRCKKAHTLLLTNPPKGD